MTMKRRVIYMDDATWESLRGHAAKRATSISEHLRAVVTGGLEMTVDEHDALGELVDETPAFLRRQTATRITGHDAFAELRPVPKPEKKRRG